MLQDPTKAATPTPFRIMEVRLSSDRTRLEISFATGETKTLAAPGLRAACRCAWCTRARIDGVFPDAFPNVSVERVTPVGGYAINIAFSDRHDRGIYPFGYLADLAAPPSPVVEQQGS